MQLSPEQPMSLQKFDDEFWTSGQTAEFLNLSVSWLAKSRLTRWRSGFREVRSRRSLFEEQRPPLRQVSIAQIDQRI